MIYLGALGGRGKLCDTDFLNFNGSVKSVNTHVNRDLKNGKLANDQQNFP